MKGLSVETVSEDIKYFLTQLQTRIDIALRDSYHFEPRLLPPKNSRIGDLVYFKSGDYEEGLHQYTSTGWVKL